MWPIARPAAMKLELNNEIYFINGHKKGACARPMHALHQMFPVPSTEHPEPQLQGGLEPAFSWIRRVHTLPAFEVQDISPDAANLLRPCPNFQHLHQHLRCRYRHPDLDTIRLQALLQLLKCLCP
jgi:hypothetical protein